MERTKTYSVTERYKINIAESFDLGSAFSNRMITEKKYSYFKLEKLRNVLSTALTIESS